MLPDLNAAAGPSTTPRKPSAYLDPADANILRARIILAKKTFDAAGDDGHFEAGLNLLAITFDYSSDFRVCFPRTKPVELPFAWASSVRSPVSPYIELLFTTI